MGLAAVTAFAQFGLPVAQASAAGPGVAHAAAGVAPKPDPELLAAIDEAGKTDLANGQSVFLKNFGTHDLYLFKDPVRGVGLVATLKGTAPAADRAQRRGPCTWAVASAIYALGAAALGAAAASGGLVVAGIFIAPRILAILSSTSGGFSALYGLVGQYIC